MKILITVVLCIGLQVAGQGVLPGEEKNPCAQEKDRLTSSGAVAPGTFVPTCNDNGWYNHQQIHGSTGYSWCVDPSNGREIPNTRVGPGQTSNCPKCLIDKATALPAPRFGLVAGYVPRCDNHGHFEIKQINPSTGYSWCVDRNTGVEAAGTRIGPGQQQPGRPCDQPDNH